MNDLFELRQQVYKFQQSVDVLERIVYEQNDYTQLPQLMEAQARLQKAEKEIHSQEQAVASKKNLSKEPISNNSVSRAGGSETIAQDELPRQSSNRHVYRGLETTGLRVEIHSRLQYVPTAIYHLFEENEFPLLEFRARTNSSRARRLRVTAYIERYSAQAVRTVEVDQKEERFCLLPTLFPDMIRQVSELTRASLNIKVEDLDNDRVEEHQTRPVWLLAYNAIPLEVRDLATYEIKNLRKYLAALVTPNQPDVQFFLNNVNNCHPEHRLTGYLDLSTNPPYKQVEAIFTALKQAHIGYTHSGVVFIPDQGLNSQRVRLPREVLLEKQSNCLEGALLFASLLEAIQLNPTIVLNRGHAIVGWQQQNDSPYWDYLDTTLINEMDFDMVVEQSNRLINAFQKYETLNTVPLIFRLNFQELRIRDRIYPLE